MLTRAEKKYSSTLQSHLSVEQHHKSLAQRSILFTNSQKAMTHPTKAMYEFGPFRIDMERYLLLRDEESIPLSPKAFETLVFLVQHRGEVGRKDDIMSSIWPDTFVEESNLAQNIFLLRKALGEDKHEHRYIVTIPGVGYRFVAPVRELAGADQAPVRDTGQGVSSIAVLPFKSIAAQESDAFLGPGLADALIMRLSSIRDMKVRPTTAVLKYGSADHDPLLIGRELKVDALLTGVIQHEGEKIRVSVQLVSVKDGITLWADKFDDKFTDIFAIQDSISEQVVRSLALKLSGEEQRQLRKNYTDNPEVFHLYLKGRYFWNQRNADGLKKALVYAQQAIALEPTYAPAYVGLADTYSLLGAQHGVLPPRESFPKARAAALRALEIDGTIAEAYASLGFINCCHAWDWSAAEQNYLKAIDLKPNYPTAHHWYGELLVTLGRFNEAVIELQMARELDPLSLAINADLAASYYYARQYDKSESQLRSLLEFNPNFVRAHIILGKVYGQRGNHAEAIEILRRAVGLTNNDAATRSALAHGLAIAGATSEARQNLDHLQQLSARTYVSAGSIAEILVGLGQKDEAHIWLEKAYADRDIEMIWLNVDPLYDPIRDDAQFKALIQRVNPALI
ncbi:MAG: cadC 15 [Acidobacteria bacterium]|nr:cadC 15 [Acidobacteriota bacterium]